MAEQVALSLLATQGLQELRWGWVSIPSAVTAMPRSWPAGLWAAQLAAVLVVGQRLDEGPVYLDAIDGQAPSRLRGETGAEVVDGDLYPQRLEAGEEPQTVIHALMMLSVTLISSRSAKPVAQ
jgi:hypothetical protein